MDSNLKFNLQAKADPKSLDLMEKVNTSLVAVLTAIKAIPPFRIDWPKIFPITGRVVATVDRVPPVTVLNLDDMSPYFNEISQGIAGLEASTISTLKTLTPKEDKSTKSVIVTNSLDIKNFSDLLDGIEELKKGFNLLLKKDFGTISGPEVQKVELTNFRQFVPTPVTNVSVNGLGGFVKTNAITVGTSLSALPGNAGDSLLNRRAVVLYNNGAVTFYVGGSDVTSSNGMPIPAGTYSPAIDAGPNMVVYGRTASGSTDVRVMELSDIATGR